jgi:uncharacterized protein (DUF1330 family)
MSAYAIAQLRTVDVNHEVREYLSRIDATLRPYGGRFLVHGTTPEVVDGDLPGTIVLIEFPDADQARGWYESPAYQAILPLRTRNCSGGAALLPGRPEGYLAASLLDRLGPGEA